MSAFLGPIHHWLYHKIKTQEELVQAYVTYAIDHEAADLETKLANAYGVLPTEPLEDVIDEGNIHGWLQDKVSMVEGRLAMVVTNLLQANHMELDTMRNIAFEFGKQHTCSEVATPRDAYQYLNNTLVDGMPCDHVNVLVSETEHEIVWKRSQCVHEAYWNEVGGDVSVFYDIRTQWIRGMFDGTNVTFESMDDETYCIRM